jgi:lipoprotein-releasing system permease protein
MSFSFYLSKKYTLSKKDSRFINFISGFSIAGIALGVATLIIALSILNGFEDTITKKIIDFDSHIQVFSYRNSLPSYIDYQPQIVDLLFPHAEGINPYASKLAIIGTRSTKEGVNIKGIIPENNAINVKHNIVEGEFKFENGEVAALVIGRKLANKLLVHVGDVVTVFALRNEQLPSFDNLPNIQKFKINGIFESGMAEYDDLYAYTNLSTAQKLFDFGDKISGYDIKLKDISKIDSLTSVLANELRYPYAVRSIYQTHRNIFTWIELQKEPIPLILALISIVAVFNIIGTLLMIVLEKTQAIGILKSLGATKKQIIGIFIYQGAFLAILGILIGNIAALILTYLQLEFNLISIPSSVYFMSAIPILLKPEVFGIVSIITFVLSIVVSIIPSYIASKIDPVTALRFS